MLSKILGVADGSAVALNVQSSAVGWSDPRFDISLPEGFEIFRVYKGTEYRAKALT